MIKNKQFWMQTFPLVGKQAGYDMMLQEPVLCQVPAT